MSTFKTYINIKSSSLRVKRLTILIYFHACTEIYTPIHILLEKEPERSFGE